MHCRDGRPVDRILPLPAGLKPPYYVQMQMAVDPAGVLWVFVPHDNFFFLQNGEWKRFKTPSELSKMEASTVSNDSQGLIWIGYHEGLIARFDGTVIRTYSATDGLDVGAVRALYGVGQHLWIGGASGLMYFDGSNRFLPVTPVDSEAFGGVSGVVETADGALWLSEFRGIIRIPAPEIQRILKDPSYRVQYRLFDSFDGLPGGIQETKAYPTAIQGTDGRLWFATTGGLVWVNPANISQNMTPAPVTIQTVVADSQKYAPTEDLRLPARTKSLQIDYAALSLSVPERNSFKYRLEGVDQDWQDVGARREAFYTNLGPGSYRFRVIASNNDGVWNQTGAALNLVIAPAFYQTWWFQLFCLALAGGTLWLFYLYRLKVATAQIQYRLGARMEERERIARELHDTLLQGFQGLMLRFQAVMKTLPENESAHQMMEKALDRADEVLSEGRERVRELRAEDMTGDDLPNYLIRWGEELAQDHATLFSLSTVGEPAPLDPTVCGESYRIGREAVSNAFQHSGASRIEVEVTYADASVRLTVRDDGSGMDQKTLDSGRTGHWGLIGMRERAQKIGAKLSIWSHPGAGTEMELWIPASVAYLNIRKKAHWANIKRVIKR